MRNIHPGVLWVFCIAGLLGFQTPVLAASTHQLVAKGNTLFSAGKYDEALEVYEQAAVNMPESPYLYFNKGAALYKKGDYATATEAFQQAALKSKDIALEAKSTFNLGLCAVREAERQQDSDLNKALDAYGKSIQYFRETLELDPDFQDAAENIELVRLIMKSILDEIKKREEEAKKQQEQMQNAAKKLEALIERQQDLSQRNSSLSQEAQQNGQSEDMSSKMQNLAKEQDALQQDTQQLADTLANQNQNVQGAEPEAVTHLYDSVQEQELAVQQFEQNQSQPAGEHQQKSLEALIKAQESFKQQQQQGQQQGQQRQQQSQQGQQQQQQAQTDQQEKTPPDQEKEQAGSEQGQQQEEQQQRASVAQLPDDAESILDEEKENNMRRTYGNMSGGYNEVDKDW